MSELSEMLHLTADDKQPVKMSLRSRSNNIGPRALEQYGLHILEEPTTSERREQPSKEEIDMLHATGYMPIGWNRAEDVLMVHPEFPDILAYDPETKRFEKIN